MLKIIDRYIGRELVTSAFFAVSVLTFVLVLGQIFKKLFELMVDHDIPATYIIRFIACVMPLSLIYSIPWGVLTAVLLVFGRLSAGNELTALRTAGVSIPRIARPVLLWAVVFSVLCLWINLYVAPRAQQNLKDAFIEVVTRNPAAAFSADRVIDEFPGKRFYIGSVDGARLENVHVFNLDPNNKPISVVYAEHGDIETDHANRQIKLLLEHSRFEQRDDEQPDDLTKIRDGIKIGDWIFSIPLDELYAKRQGRRRIEWYPFQELREDLARKRELLRKDTARLRQSGDLQAKKTLRAEAEQVAASATELNRRFSFSLACLTFALIGIPLGITAHRQETSIGFGLSLVVGIAYYTIIIVVGTIRTKASVHPELLIWLPNVIFLLLGGVLFLRLSRR